MADERTLGIIPDARHEPARAPAPEWLFGGPPRTEERPGWFHDPRLRYDLVITDRRLIVMPVVGSTPDRREVNLEAAPPAEVVARTPGCRSVWPTDVTELIVDRQPLAIGEYSSDWAVDLVLRSPIGAETRFRAVNFPRTAEQVVGLFAPAFEGRVRRARVVRHGLFRRATRE